MGQGESRARGRGERAERRRRAPRPESEARRREGSRFGHTSTSDKRDKAQPQVASVNVQAYLASRDKASGEGQGSRDGGACNDKKAAQQDKVSENCISSAAARPRERFPRGTRALKFLPLDCSVPAGDNMVQIVPDSRGCLTCSDGARRAGCAAHATADEFAAVAAIQAAANGQRGGWSASV